MQKQSRLSGAATKARESRQKTVAMNPLMSPRRGTKCREAYGKRNAREMRI